MRRPQNDLKDVSCFFFDFFDTIVSKGKLSPKTTVTHLYKSLRRLGYRLPEQEFVRIYSDTYRRYLKVRVEKLREVGSNVWVSEALKSLGYRVEPDDPSVIKAVDEQYVPLIRSTRLMPDTLKTLRQISKSYKLGLITNFTYANVIYKILDKLELMNFFQTVQISHEVGYRKPHSKIFQDALKDLSLAPYEAVMVGDNPNEDIVGAFITGLRSVLVLRHSSYLQPSLQLIRPDFIIQGLKELLGLIRL